VDLEFLLLIEFHFCLTSSIIVVVVILISFASFQDLSSHLQLSSWNVIFLLMELMIVMDCLISGDVSVDLICLLPVVFCLMLLLSLPSLWFIVVTSFIASVVFNHGIIREMDHGCLSLPPLPVVVAIHRL
jgi:hypothetical protein